MSVILLLPPEALDILKNTIVELKNNTDEKREFALYYNKNVKRGGDVYV